MSGAVWISRNIKPPTWKCAGRNYFQLLLPPSRKLTVFNWISLTRSESNEKPRQPHGESLWKTTSGLLSNVVFCLESAAVALQSWNPAEQTRPRISKVARIRSDVTLNRSGDVGPVVFDHWQMWWLIIIIIISSLKMKCRMKMSEEI